MGVPSSLPPMAGVKEFFFLTWCGERQVRSGFGGILLSCRGKENRSLPPPRGGKDEPTSIKKEEEECSLSSLGGEHPLCGGETQPPKKNHPPPPPPNNTPPPPPFPPILRTENFFSLADGPLPVPAVANLRCSRQRLLFSCGMDTFTERDPDAPVASSISSLSASRSPLPHNGHRTFALSVHLSVRLEVGDAVSFFPLPWPTW